MIDDGLVDICECLSAVAYTAPTVRTNRSAFAKMDLDDNGSIDADELGLILKSFGEAVPRGRLKALISEVKNKTRCPAEGSGVSERARVTL